MSSRSSSQGLPPAVRPGMDARDRRRPDDHARRPPTAAAARQALVRLVQPAADAAAGHDPEHGAVRSFGLGPRAGGRGPAVLGRA